MQNLNNNKLVDRKYKQQKSNKIILTLDFIWFRSSQIPTS